MSTRSLSSRLVKDELDILVRVTTPGLAKREGALARERGQLDQRHQREARKLRRAAEEAGDAYKAALDEWEP